MCSRVPLLPYIKEGRGRPADPCRARQERGVLLGLQVLVGFHLVEGGRRKGEGEGQGKGCRAPSPSPIRTPHGGHAPPPCGLPSLSPKAHVGPLVPPGFPITPRHSDNYPVTPGTHPVSEYSHPIYQSLCLNHFETPRHVHDHIRDSELPPVHQNT